MRIGLILTGGTIGSSYSERGITPDGEAPLLLLEKYREQTGDLTEFPSVSPFSILSENLTLSHIGALAALIREKSAEWDGIILTHGSDTLQYTGAALSYILGNSCTPVVLVSANYPVGDARSNGVANLIGAISFLRGERAAHGVYISYQNSGEDCCIYRATRALAHHATSDALYAISAPVARILHGKLQYDDDFYEQEDGQAPLSENGLTVAAERVLWLHAHPGMVYPPLDGVTAVLISTYHCGTLATATTPLKRFAKRAKESGVPVFLAGVPAGGTAYESGNAFGDLGLCALPPIAPIAAYLKLCLSLADGRDIYKALLTPLGGDL